MIAYNIEEPHNEIERFVSLEKPRKYYSFLIFGVNRKDDRSK